jgi:hypothetical protein
MIRTFTIGFALLVSTRSASAQATRKAPQDSLSTRFVGVWDGRFVADHGPTGGMQVTIARDSAWKVSIEMAHGDQPIANRVTDVKADGKKMSWSQDVMGMACTSSVTVDGEKMTGEAACGQMSYTIDLHRIK